MATLLFKYRSPFPKGRAPELPQPPARPAGDQEDDAPGEDKRDRWWYESSYDLRAGLDVDDDAASTLPGDLIDELFKR